MIKNFWYVSLYIGRFVPRDNEIFKELPAKITKAAKEFLHQRICFFSQLFL